MGQATNKQINFANNIAKTLNIELPEHITFESLSDFINTNVDSFYKEQKTKDETRSAELREKIVKSVKIVDIASEMGFTVTKLGKKYFSLKEHDSVVIDSEKNCYWRNSVSGKGHSIGKGGSVIDFVLMFGNQTIEEVMKDFTNRVSGKSYEQIQYTSQNKTKNIERVQEKNLILPQKGENMRRVYAYLIKSRYLDPDIVQEFVNRKMLYQDQRNNCVFVSYDQDNKTPIFASYRGTNTEKRFLGDVENCDYEKGFYIDNKANTTIVTESVIDAMSVMTILNAQGDNYKMYNYMPLNGATKIEALVWRLDNTKQNSIILALDNDKAGIENAERIRNIIKEKKPEFIVAEVLPEHTKDWNDEISFCLQHSTPIKDIDFYGVRKYKQSIEKEEKEQAKKKKDKEKNKKKDLEVEIGC